MKMVRAGAVLWFLWGLLHVIGGASLLHSTFHGPENFPTALSGKPMTEKISGAMINPVFAYHSFNILWIGAVVALVSLRRNWRNSRSGWLINLLLVGFADLGLVLFMVAPGIISWAEASLGLGLFCAALVCSSIGLRHEPVTA